MGDDVVVQQFLVMVMTKVSPADEATAPRTRAAGKCDIRFRHVTIAAPCCIGICRHFLIPSIRGRAVAWLKRQRRGVLQRGYNRT